MTNESDAGLRWYDRLFLRLSFSASGSGLGLAISREIVLSLNGSIALSNAIRENGVAGLDARVSLATASP
ncbi:MAG: hypothetical protein LBI87_01150 [Candidatus Accumulibacter sp.]|nr:hypothetical protein [Accumulibacter sp.]